MTEALSRKYDPNHITFRKFICTGIKYNFAITRLNTIVNSGASPTELINQPRTYLKNTYGLTDKLLNIVDCVIPLIPNSTN